MTCRMNDEVGVSIMYSQDATLLLYVSGSAKLMIGGL